MRLIQKVARALRLSAMCVVGAGCAVAPIVRLPVGDALQLYESGRYAEAKAAAASEFGEV